MSIKNKKDIIYGTVELSPDTFTPQNVKERITTMVDQDALVAFKKAAKERNMKYQTLLNQVIRAFVGLGEEDMRRKMDISEERIRRIVRDELKKRA